MSVLEIYINWVNSVLGESGSYVDGVEAVQDGKVLCELIDVLAPDAGLVNKVKASGECTPIAYITTALEHMKSHGIKIKFPSQDIVHNEIKSMLDVLWLLILNYGIHFIGQSAVQRSVGAGKKKLLEWCQEELGAAFDAMNTLSFNLCNGSWFVKLLEKMAGCSMTKSEDKAEYIDSLLTEIQDRYLIKKDIIKGHDIVDGTADEHTLMIYLSLLKRRMSYSDRPSRREMLSTDGKAAAMAKIHFFEKRARSLSNESNSPRSQSLESPVHRGRSLSSGGRSSSANSDANGSRTRSKSLFEQTIADGNETSDWSSTGSLISGREKSSPQRIASPVKREESSVVLHQTISDRVGEQFPITSESDRDDKEAESQRVSEKETDTLSEFSSSSLVVRDKPPVEIIVQSHDRVSNSAVNGRDERPDNHSRHRHEGNGISRRNKNGTNTLDLPSSALNGSTRTRNEIENVGHINSNTGGSIGIQNKNGTDILDQRSLDTTNSTLNRGNRNGTLMSDEGNIHTNSMNTEGSKSPGGISRERQLDRDRRLGSPVDADARIKIKRPKDYILQWEDTMDRLSGVSASDDPSPRHPLISNFRVETPPRSKSSEVKSAMNRTQDFASIRSRSSDLTNRSSVRFHPSLSSSLSSSGSRQMSSTVKGNVSSDQSLDAVLAQLPEDMRQKAADASKFLMQTSGPEVIALIDAIKEAREGVQKAMPNEETRLLNPTSSPSGSRVRFHNSSRSPTQRETNSMSSTSVASPRVHSSSPYRQNLTSVDEIERGENAMLSISPRSRSRSLSPGHTSNTKPQSDMETYTRTQEIQENPESTQVNRSLREEMMLRSLGMNARVVEDERPSSRIMAMASSPRHVSPGRAHQSSPRKPLASEKNYPEVTRLDLGLDSDRSYTSQVEDNAVDEVTPRRGGSGRVPRREAWELQKRKREQIFLANHEDPAAQSKFIDVLCKEIDALKVKVEMMEDEGVTRSRSQSHKSPSAFNSRISDSSYLNRNLHEDDNELILATQTRLPCKFDRNNSCPLLEVSSRTNLLSKTSSAKDDSTYVKQAAASRHNSRGAYSSTSASRSSAKSRSPTGQRIGGISLGYRGPSRSITPEIWGNDLNSPDGLDPSRQEKWKRLISLRELSEGEVIELKQALACAIVEHDILSAKLNNAKHEIHDKLRHTNEVLDDCRHHLAKSQAENMELRSKTEQERQRADNFESRIKEMENTVHEVHKDNKHLEKELDKTAIMLDKSLVETKPGIGVLREEKAKLVSRLASAETENEKMKNDMERMKRNQDKTMQTMDELRECLCKVRGERQELFEQLDLLQRREQTSRVKQIINNYQERGMIPNSEQDHFSRHESSQRSYEPLDSDEGIFSGSQNSTELPLRSSLQALKNDPISVRTDTSSRLLDTSFSSSPGNTPRGSASQHRYFNDEVSPSDREIYPHRKSYLPRSRSCSPHSSFNASSLPNDSYFDTSNLDNSLINQTLQDIEQDMQRERENLLFRVNNQHKLRFIPYLENDSYRSHNRSASSSRVKETSDRGFSSDRSPHTSSNRQYADFPKYHSARTESTNSNSGKASYPLRENLPNKRSTSLGSVGTSPRQSILKSGSRPVSRSRSPPPNRNSLRDENRSGYITPERSGSPVYFPRSSHSPPTRLSPENKEKCLEKRRPRYEKSKPGEISRNLQKEFEKENKLIASLSNSPVFKNKSWIEVQSDSDEDTGINSSISSLTSSERSGIARKKTPFLSDEQRRYADELIHKYTGNPPS